MPNPNMTQDEYLQMFGTKEEIEAWNKHQAEFKKWIEENVPVWEPPKNMFLHNRSSETENKH